MTVLLMPALVFYRQVERALSEQLDDALRSVAKAELASAIDDPDEPPHVHNSEEIALITELEEIAWIVDSKGKLVMASGGLASSEVERFSLTLAGKEGLSSQSFGGKSYRFLVTSLSHRGETYTEVLGLSREPLEETLRTLKGEMIGIFFGAMAALSLVSLYLSKRLTAPLTRLAEEVERLGPDSQALPTAEGVADREVALLHRNIDSLLKRLDQVLTAQRTFIADASHEIRAPLTNMKVALEVSLRKQREAEDYREVLEVCHNEVLRLGSLAERLLTLSRLDSEQYGLRMVPSEISEIVNSALEPIRSRAKECALELSVRLQEAEVNCDPEAIRQVVDNLIDNALRHAPSGGTVEIELTLTQGEVEFAVVNDQGHLNLDSEARLFDRFYRSDSSRDRKTGGAGLGLAIVAAFVKAHGGRCGVRAVPGHRIAFWFSLPRALS